MSQELENDLDAYGRSRKTHREQARARRAADPEKARADYKRYRSRHPKLCSERTRAWATKNPEKYCLAKRRVHLRKFGLTIEQYDVLLIKQHNLCAICNQPEKHGRKGQLFRLSVDHCHTTNRVRGLLCNDCNRAIGLLNDNPARCTRAAEYLR